MKCGPVRDGIGGSSGVSQDWFFGPVAPVQWARSGSRPSATLIRDSDSRGGLELLRGLGPPTVGNSGRRVRGQVWSQSLGWARTQLFQAARARARESVTEDLEIARAVARLFLEHRGGPRKYGHGDFL